MSGGGEPRGRADGWWVLALGAAARGAVALWATGRVPPAADGIFYHKLAERLASGQGYTWLWPDGVVTYAAHYPVGYPALLSLAYRVAGAHPAVGFWLNAALGALGAWAIHGLARRSLGRWAALVAGLLVALDPALVLYTPALMTEGVTAALLALGALAAARSGEQSGKGWRNPWLPLTALIVGVSVLVRPQCLLLAPVLGALALGAGWRRRLAGAAIVLAGALLVCAPWTARNCVRMKSCALVSVNGGWNLLIGASPKATGHWSPVDVPPACREVFDEAGKDACFGAAARAMIADEPGRWLALVPARLAATFDYCGAAPWYLHEAAPGAFGWEAKQAAGAFETVFHRLVLAAALVALGSGEGRAPRARRLLGALGLVLAFTRPGYLAYLALGLLGGLSWWASPRRPALVGALGAAIGTTALVHGAFFGAGRYSLVVFPFVTACAAGLLTGLPARGDTAPHAAD